MSVSKVSRALNDQPLISARTKRRIWALARDHNYPFRQSMPSAPIGAEGSIAIVTPHTQGQPLPLSHPFFLELLASIGEAARARGCDFTVSHVAPASYDDLVQATTTSRASGVIFLGQGALHNELNELADSDARFAVWGAQMPDQRYRSIGTDNWVGGPARHASSGPGLAGATSCSSAGTTQRPSSAAAAMHRRLRKAASPRGPHLVAQVEFDLDSADAAITRILQRGTKFDGIVAASDLMALGAIRALHRKGLSVPGDVSVVGYDDMLLSRLSTPTLTTIRQRIRPRAAACSFRAFWITIGKVPMTACPPS